MVASSIAIAATIDIGGTGVVTLDPALIDGGSIDNCPGWTLSVSPSTFSAIGSYSVTLTVTDVAGNTDDCTVTLTVIDTDPPICLTVDTTLYLDAVARLDAWPENNAKIGKFILNSIKYTDL